MKETWVYCTLWWTFFIATACVSLSMIQNSSSSDKTSHLAGRLWELVHPLFHSPAIFFICNLKISLANLTKISFNFFYHSKKSLSVCFPLITPIKSYSSCSGDIQDSKYEVYWILCPYFIFSIFAVRKNNCEGNGSNAHFLTKPPVLFWFGTGLLPIFGKMFLLSLNRSWAREIKVEMTSMAF